MPHFLVKVPLSATVTHSSRPSQGFATIRFRSRRRACSRRRRLGCPLELRAQEFQSGAGYDLCRCGRSPQKLGRAVLELDALPTRRLTVYRSLPCLSASSRHTTHPPKGCANHDDLGLL